MRRKKKSKTNNSQQPTEGRGESALIITRWVAMKFQTALLLRINYHTTENPLLSAYYYYYNAGIDDFIHILGWSVLIYTLASQHAEVFWPPPCCHRYTRCWHSASNSFQLEQDCPVSSPLSHVPTNTEISRFWNLPVTVLTNWNTLLASHLSVCCQ